RVRRKVAQGRRVPLKVRTVLATEKGQLAGHQRQKSGDDAMAATPYVGVEESPFTGCFPAVARHLLTARTRARSARTRPRGIAWNEVMRDQTGLDHLIVDTKKPPFDNAKVREAVSCAIDRRGLIAAIHEGGAAPRRL